MLSPYWDVRELAVGIWVAKIKKNYRINHEHCCDHGTNTIRADRCGTFIARWGSAVDHQQCSCETSSRAARPRVADALPPRYSYVRGRNVALRIARSAREIVGAGMEQAVAKRRGLGFSSLRPPLFI